MLKNIVVAGLMGTPFATYAYAGPVEHKGTVAVVDACSTGVYIAPLLNGMGYDVTHITSELGRVTNLGPDLINFKENIDFFGNLSEVGHRLLNRNVIAVIPGCESGVYLADELSSQLKLPTSNGTSKSKARRDKFLMQEALREAHIASIKQIRADQVEDILTWVRTTLSRSSSSIVPIVLKPLSSSGTDNVYFCNSESEIRQAFEKIMNSKNVFKEKNTAVLAQEKILGQEYMINSVSSFGKHYIAEIWRIYKNSVNNSPLYDYAELVLPSESEFGPLRAYVSHVLDALDIKHGAGHSEVILTGDRGPVLIETAARLGGGNDPSAAVEATGFSQTSLLVDSYINRERFHQIYNAGYPVYKKRALVSYLRSNAEGLIVKPLNRDNLYSLDGFHGLWLDLAVGDQMVITRDAETIPGSVFLIGTDMNVLRSAHLVLSGLVRQ